MFSYIFTRFRSIHVIVEVDPLLMPSLNCADKVNQHRIVEINLHNLIYNICSIPSPTMSKILEDLEAFLLSQPK